MLIKELADKTGISRRTLDNYLRDSPASPTAENAVKIARALGVSVEYLVTGEHPAYSTPVGVGDLRPILRGAEALSPAARQVVLDVINSLMLHLASR